MNKRLVKISLIINIVITIMVISACTIMFTGFKFMHGHEIALESSKLSMFRFFTVDSNILMGIASLIFAYQELLVIRKKQKDIKKGYYLLKLMGTSAVTLTFIITFTYLGSISEYGLSALLMNSNLLFHLIIPVSSILVFCLFERNNKISFKNIIWGIVPTLIYGIYYLTNILIHMENGKVSTEYDFYWFVQNGVKTAFIVVPLLFLISYIISLIIWVFNHKRHHST